MPDYIAQLRCRLAELGCPRSRLNRITREVADHREDLILFGTHCGQSMPAASEAANRQLGDPLTLADGLMNTFRRSSWWGRHYLVAFGFLPLVAFPLVWGLFMYLQFQLAYAIRFQCDDQKLHAIANNPVTLHHWAVFAYGCDYAAIGLVSLLICWLARRSGVSLLWMTIACLVGATYALVTYTHVSKDNYMAGLTFHPQWIRAAIPVGIAVATCLCQRWIVGNARRRVAALR
jgi:hypothetical protein